MLSTRHVVLQSSHRETQLSSRTHCPQLASSLYVNKLAKMEFSKFCRTTTQHAVLVAVATTSALFAPEAHGFEAFEACQEENVGSDIRSSTTSSSPTIAATECHMEETNFQQLLKVKKAAYTSFQLQNFRIGNYVKFSQALRQKILDRLRKRHAELEAVSSCQPSGQESIDSCTRSLNTYRSHVRSIWPELVNNLSLAYPREVNPHMFNSKVTWFDTHPKHPFANSEAIPPLNAKETQRLEKVFLNRLADEVPEIANYLATKHETTRLLAESPKDEALIRIAMVKIRNESRQRYVEILRQNPLMAFIGTVAEDAPDSPSNQALQSALKKMKDEVQREITIVEGGGLESERRILKYRNLANDVLANSPHWCPAAVTAQKAASDEEGSAQLKESAMLVGASVLSLATCSTLVLCGAAGAVLGAIDYKMALDKSRDAFQEGIVDSAVGQSSDAIVRSADHRMAAGASLAVSAVSALVGGTTLLKETTRATAKVAAKTSKTAQARREVMRIRSSDEIKQRGWLPASADEMAAYSRLHISEVQSQARRLFEKHKALFPSLSAGKLKLLKQHDREKVLDFKTLRDRHGYLGVPTELLRDHMDFAAFVTKQSADGRHIELSLNEALEVLWGQNPNLIAVKAKAARSHAEFKHWKSMDELRKYVIDNLNRIDGEIMEESMRHLHSPNERVEMRLVEFLSDLTARKSNPLTEFEFGREITSTADFVRKMGKEGLVTKLAGGSDSPMEIHAARQLLDRVKVDEIAEIATWLEAK